MSRLRRIFAVIALALVIAPLAANAPLFDPDEGLHAAIAQEMVLRGDYVTPTFLGEPFLDKPILFFWTEAASLRLFGNREAAVRLPPLLFGLLGMIAVAALGRTLFDETTGLVAGIVYGTMVLPLGVSEVAVHDVAVVPFMCAACAWMFGSDSVASTFRWKILLAGIALGLSILTKGLVGVVFTGILAACLAFENPKNAMRLAAVLAIAGVVAILVALPWYVAMERAHPGYLHYYFVERHLQGYLTATQRHAGRGWWYYIPIVIGGALPWTGYLAGAARGALGSRMRLVTWGWFLAGFVFLSAGESKLVTYALPLFPALAILAAERIVAAGTFAGRLAYGTFVTSLAILPLGALIAVALRFGGVSVTSWLIVLLASAAIAVVGIRLRPDRASTLHDRAAAVMGLPVMALLALMIVAPRAASWMTARDLAASLNSAGTLPPYVSVLDERIGSLVFYLAPPLRASAAPGRIDNASIAEAIGRMRAAPDDAVLAVRDDRLARFNRLFATPPVPAAHAGTFTIFRAGPLREALQAR
jgi:4-amino-4-deoxy-L-arabinose transferase-like glycosyltransferase